MIEPITALACLSTALALHGDTVYVDDDAPPNGDGTSWDAAYSSLQDAIDAAVRIGCSTSINVAQGLYLPSLVGDRSASLDVTEYNCASGATLVIRGGYAGLGHSNPDEWNPDEFITVISGDLANNDGPEFSNRTDNSDTLLTARATTNAGPIVFEGFTFTGGHCRLDARGGGAVHVDRTSGVMFRRCRFTGNNAVGDGGAIHVGRQGRIAISECILDGNRTGGSGGTLFIDGFGDIEQCLFVNNESVGPGGAASVRWTSWFRHCTLVENRAAQGHAAIGGPGTPSIIGSIAWGNGLDPVTAGALTTYSCIEGGRNGVGNIALDPMFVDPRGGDLRLRPNSPCIDAGDNASGWYGLDLAGQPRFLDDAGTIDTGAGQAPIIDIGAFEYQGTSCLPDFTRDGRLNIFDFLGFLTEFSAGSPRADLAAPFGVFNAFDFLIFAELFNQGC